MDELHTLEMVLTDQRKTMREMNEMLGSFVARDGVNPALVDLRVLDGHLSRIRHMKNMADNASKLVSMVLECSRPAC